MCVQKREILTLEVYINWMKEPKRKSQQLLAFSSTRALSNQVGRGCQSDQNPSVAWRKFERGAGRDASAVQHKMLLLKMMLVVGLFRFGTPVSAACRGSYRSRSTGSSPVRSTPCRRYNGMHHSRMGQSVARTTPHPNVTPPSATRRKNVPLSYRAVVSHLSDVTFSLTTAPVTIPFACFLGIVTHTTCTPMLRACRTPNHTQKDVPSAAAPSRFAPIPLAMLMNAMQTY